ncbi:NAD(P)H-binding protein [Serratia nevei]|uniref:NAD(P)H-binding protein n=1 Tax=Serratia nevei TaxID=2703794 RepID=UPI00313DFCC4
MSTVFIIGGAGKVGRRLARILTEKGHAVHALHRQPEQAHLIRQQGAMPVSGSLTELDAEALATMMRGCDVVVFSAGADGKGGPEMTNAIDGEGFKTAAEAAALASISRFPLMFARLARNGGASAFALTSATGANVGSRFFYNLVKGELEQALRQENFPSLTLVRPGVIAGDRAESRPGEAALKQVLRLLSPILPRSWQLSPAEDIARHLLTAVTTPRSGIHIVSAGEINSAR